MMKEIGMIVIVSLFIIGIITLALLPTLLAYAVFGFKAAIMVLIIQMLLGGITGSSRRCK